MNKAAQFWQDLWREGRTHFHCNTVNSDLQDYWQVFNTPPIKRILVPLCGKSIDMLWLAAQAIEVVGVELCELAVLQFAEENNLQLRKENHGQINCYSSDLITIWVADIFSLKRELIAPVDAIYDRAALIALPETLRAAYVQACLQWLKPSGKILLKTMSYDESEMQGPPYSVPAAEVEKLYGLSRTIKCLNETVRHTELTDPLRARGLLNRTDSVWLI